VAWTSSRLQGKYIVQNGRHLVGPESTLGKGIRHVGPEHRKDTKRKASYEAEHQYDTKWKASYGDEDRHDTKTKIP